MTGKKTWPLVCSTCGAHAYFDLTEPIPACKNCGTGHYRAPTKSQLRGIRKKEHNEAML